MTEPVLEIRGLSKAFGGLRATDDVSLTLVPGEIHALIGPNGAGKSTLIAQIAGDLAPDAGAVAFAGADVTGEDSVARARRGLARTFQISSLAMEMTVLQNVVLGALGQRGGVFSMFRNVMRDRDLVDRARAALARVWLDDFAATRVADLSHGQRRAVEIAVALVRAPKAFLMDEPFAGMGMDGARQLVEVLDTLRAEAPVLLVEHDMDVVFALADRISVLVAGRIIATGTADRIRADATVRAAYLGEDADTELAP